MSLRVFISTLAILITTCCSERNTNAINSTSSRPAIKRVNANRLNVKTFLPNLCDTFAIEFDGLYSVLDSLPEATADSVLLDNILIAKGFVVVNSGRGNWQGGPRLIAIDLQRDSCFCSVYKKYYSRPQSDSLQISERLVCNTRTINGVEE